VVELACSLCGARLKWRQQIRKYLVGHIYSVRRFNTHAQAVSAVVIITANGPRQLNTPRGRQLAYLNRHWLIGEIIAQRFV
jgi:hypothetical protein